MRLTSVSRPHHSALDGRRERLVPAPKPKNPCDIILLQPFSESRYLFVDRLHVGDGMPHVILSFVKTRTDHPSVHGSLETFVDLLLDDAMSMNTASETNFLDVDMRKICRIVFWPINLCQTLA